MPRLALFAASPLAPSPTTTAQLARLAGSAAVRWLLMLAACVALGATALAPSLARAQTPPGALELVGQDPPGQVARVNFTDGPVSVLAASVAEPSASAQPWTAADLNRPLTSGDRIATALGARAELHVGSTALRLAGLNGPARLELQNLNDSTLQLQLNEGSLIMRVRALFDGQRIEISTPNLGLTVTQPGEYRLDVNLATDTTRVVVQSGGGTIEGESTPPLTIAAAQQGSFSGTQLALAAPGSAVQDSFDAWASARDRLEDQSVTARYVPREVVGYQQLDTYGDWTQDAAYGAVWLPRNVSASWAPYREGQWRWVAPWGWTWVDDAPWGFAPFHYGRWAQIGPRWGWVPGRLAPRPVYAPALVGFIGGPGPGLRDGQRLGLGWFPLAPGEAYRPAYRSSPRYQTQINRNISINPVDGGYRFQRQGSAVTSAATDDFARGRSVRGRAWSLSADELARTPLMNNRFDAVPSFRGALRPGAPTPRFSDAPIGRGSGGLPPGAGNTINATAPPLARPPVVAPAPSLLPPAIQPTRPLDRPNEPTPANVDTRPFGNPNGRMLERTDSRPADTLLEADIRARREQQRLQFEQQRAQDQLTRQQEAQRQRDQASMGERALRQQQEQAQRLSQQSQQSQQQQQQQLQQQQNAQRQDIQRAQQQQLQSQQQRIDAQQQEAVGQRALREQAERQQQSDARVRAQQNLRQSWPNQDRRGNTGPDGNNAAPDGNPRGNDRRGFGRPE